MEILSIKRPNNGNPTTGLKIYATVRGDEHNGVVVEYKVGYFRRPSFRGWMCSCPNFILSQFGKGGHCKHINLIQDQYGRYGALVLPSKQKARVLSPVTSIVALKIGQKVNVPATTNPYWTGDGNVVGFVHENNTVIVKMTSGKASGTEGGFKATSLLA